MSILGALLLALSTSSATALRIGPVARPWAPINVARLTQCAAAGEEEPLDPRKALEEVGTLLEQVKALWTEGSTWSPAERDQRQRDLVTQYFRVFVPAVAFSGVQLALSIGAFVIALVALSVSHRGYDDLVRMSQVSFAPRHRKDGRAQGLSMGHITHRISLPDDTQSIPLVASALDKIDTSLGNAAIALLIVELLGPALIAIALAAAPGASASLKVKLNDWGLPDRLLPPKPISSTEAGPASTGSLSAKEK